MEATYKCVVHMIIKKDNKVLIQKRKDTKLWPGYYSLPAGHVEEGENQYDAFVREAKEELGIILDPKDIQKQYVVLNNNLFQKNGVKAENYLAYYFEIDRFKGTPKIMEKDKCEDLIWIDLKELPYPFVNYQGEFFDDKTMTFYNCEVEGAYEKE